MNKKQLKIVTGVAIAVLIISILKSATYRV